MRKGHVGNGSRERWSVRKRFREDERSREKDRKMWRKKDGGNEGEGWKREKKKLLNRYTFYPPLFSVFPEVCLFFFFLTYPNILFSTNTFIHYIFFFF